MYSTYSRSFTRKFPSEISVQTYGEMIFSKRQLGMKVYIKLLTIMGLEK